MIREFEQFHGFVLARLLHGSDRGVHIERYSPSSNAGYVVAGRVGLYVKHCSKRMTPWHFTFQPDHRREWTDMAEKLNQMFAVLICNDDGIVCLNAAELHLLLGPGTSAAWIKAARHAREMYEVTGSADDLDHKIGAGEFPAKVFETLR
ncbi:MAG: hypothetical protein JNG83_07055 [Opitutaceae bacterium]|nr:hypothetical protein [Opitutaceae bacterium]